MGRHELCSLLPLDDPAVQHARGRLARLSLYPVPLDTEKLRIIVCPTFFRLPGFRRYSGYAFYRTVVLARDRDIDDLLTHELCHIWQMQQRPWSALWSWLRYPYLENPFEIEARRADVVTRPRVVAREPGRASDPPGGGREARAAGERTAA